MEGVATSKVKYPRTLHLTWSKGRGSDDVGHSLESETAAFSGRIVVVTEKMDGENTTIYSGGSTHARSVDSIGHSSRDWIKSLAARVGKDIPSGWRLCGENLFARHSIAYNRLPSYFTCFGVYDGRDVCLSWDDTEEWCRLLDISHVPVLYRGLWDPSLIRDTCFTGVSSFGGDQEGYVVRTVGAFPRVDHAGRVGKFVRENHVQTESHWMRSAIVKNELATTAD